MDESDAEGRREPDLLNFLEAREGLWAWKARVGWGNVSGAIRRKDRKKGR